MSFCGATGPGISAGGSASRFYQGIVKGRELALNVDGMFGLVSPWEYDGPTLYTAFSLYKPTTNADGQRTCSALNRA